MMRTCREDIKASEINLRKVRDHTSVFRLFPGRKYGRSPGVVLSSVLLSRIDICSCEGFGVEISLSCCHVVTRWAMVAMATSDVMNRNTNNNSTDYALRSALRNWEKKIKP